MSSLYTIFADCKCEEPAAASGAPEAAARAGLFSRCATWRSSATTSPHTGHSHASRRPARRAQGCGPCWNSARWSARCAPSGPQTNTDDTAADACRRYCSGHSASHARPACSSLGGSHADTSSRCHQTAWGASCRQDNRASQRGIKGVARRACARAGFTR